MILAMENAGQLIEDEDLRAQIKGSGIGTSATRAEILKKLFNIKYLHWRRRPRSLTPTLLGEIVVRCLPGVHAAAPESGTHGKLGKRPHLRGGGNHHAG